ncbi:DUF7507 domain-containing protein [Dokdonella fugitiva]|uniref:DUF7507 domain-containing protein n=1 Tax=Dokdonella fugitiva TaxID=328517 RepID=UPI002410F430|nr:hypothetical protein [Dokdonella fugitiva]
MAAGDSVTLQIVATVTMPGDITNTATVDADEHDPNPANNTGGVTLNGQSADIQVLKVVNNLNPVRGDTVTFTITATNNGPSNATGVAIDDVLPAGLGFVSATPSQGTYDSGTGTWTIGNLAASGAGATATLTVVADIDTDAGFTNTASLSAIDQTDPNPANNSASVVVTPIASADLSITKTDGSASATPGAPITYTIVVANAGPSPAIGATVLDTVPAAIVGASWTCAATGGASCTFPSGVGDINAQVDIPAGGSVTFTLTGTVASNASGTLVNTATVAPPAGTTDADPANNSATDTDALNASANLAISKSDGSGTATPGAPITYTIVASNAGPSDANGVLVTDAIPTGITGASWTCVASGTAACTTTSGIGSINTTVDLPAGTTATFTVAGTVAPDATGTLANTATITPPVGTSDPDPDDDTSTDTDNLTPGADLAITKTDGATSATPGAPISYTIVASNAGPSTATNATVVDALPAAILGATWTCTGSSGATCPASGNGSINANVTIPPGASVTFTVTGTVSAAASGTLVNTATVTPPAGTTDPNAGNNSATDSDALTASADLAISKTDGATSATPGAPIIYTIVAGNAGPSDAVGATVADAIPAGITGAAWTCVGAGGATCPAGGSGDINAIVDIPVGASVTFTVSGTIDAAATGTLANTATVAPPVGTTDPVPGDNSSTDTDSLAPSANLAIGKTDGSTTATPGAPITYTIVASNAGPSAAIGALVSDALPANISGASWTCVGAGGGVCPPSGSGGISASVDLPVGGTATFTLSGTVAAAATGSLVNTATVTPPPGTADPTPGDNSATDIDTLSPNADLTVTKTDGSANATPGSAITYTIAVGNNGPSDAVGATVLDTIPAAIGGATWSAAYAGGASGPASGSGDIAATIDVPVGGSATFTVSGIVGASATGTLSNTATVLAPAGTTDPVLANNSATDTDTLTPSANLAIGKTDGSASATPGAPITYTIVASNAGPSAVTGATVADVVPANITGATWTCVGAGGGTCPPSGSGAINASVNLPVGGTATFTLSGTVAAGATGTLVNTATVTPPAGTTDPTPADNSATDTDTLAPNADLAITKTDGATSATPGAPISYTIVAGNAGPSDVTGATIADVVPASITGATWTAVYTGGASGPASGSGNIAATVDIPVGGTATFTLAGTVSAGATGTLSNTATIAAPAGTTDPTPANNSATDTDTLNPQSDLMVSKTDGSATATPGSPITYTIVASNAGPSAVIGATVADAIPATITGATWTCVGGGGATCPAGGSGNIAASVDIPVGGNATFTVTGTVSASASGTLSNTATIAAPAGTTDPTPGNNSATDTDALSPNADLAISKTDGSASATPGSPITYTIVASNAGPSDVTAATIADVVPAAITGANWTAAYAGGASGPASGSGNIAATVDVPVGGTATFTLTGTVGAGATGTLANTATIAAPAGTTDPVPGNNSATDTDTLSGSADIEAHKTGPASVTAGAAIAYSVVVTNHGPSDANATTFSDVVPAGITAVSASCGTPTGGAVCGTVGVTGNNVTSMITTLPAGASVTFTIDGTAPADPGTLANTATAQPPAGVTDPAPANNSSSVSTAVDASADLAIAKTGPTTLASGASISYTLVVSNAGPSAADGATWADSVPAAITGVTATCGSATGGATCAAPTIAGNDVTGTVPTLPAGGSVTITISGIAPFGAQSFTNTATVTGPVGVPDPNGANDQSSVTTSIGAAADIMLTKTVDNAEPNVGQTVTFTITAGNAGPNDASGVAVTDSLPFGFGFISATPSVGTYAPATGLWTIGALADGETATLLIVASVDVPGALTNTVAVSASDQPDPDTSNNSAGASVNAGASADIAVAKTVDDATPNVGAMVTYTITASNGGPNDATGVEITDNLPAGTTFVSATPSQGTYAGGVWSVGALANGASATLSISATVDQPGSIVNTATITHEDQFDPVGANNQTGTTINGQQADLGVTKTVDDPAPDVGDSVTFTVTVHNNGPSDATGVALSDALPPGLVFISATPSQGSYDNIAGVWTVGTLDAAGPGSSATLTVVAEVAAAGAMTNTASVSAADQPDPNGANNSASASLNGNPVADLAVTKSGPATVTPGDDVVYTIVVRNDGPSDASNVVVVDPTPAGLVFVSNAGACTTTYPCMLATLASGASATITTTYTVPADYAGANPIVNTASVSATEPDPDSTDNQSSASTSVGAGNANLSIVKTGPATVASGGAIAYTLLVTNNGPSPANGASYSDDVPAGIDAITAACGGEAGGAACGTQPVVSGNTVSGTIGNLPSGGSVLVTIDGVAPAGPVALSNTASVEPPAGVNDPDLIDNRSTVVTAVGAPSADLAIDKTGPASAIEGGNVTYTLTVTNNGPDVATAAQIVDPVPAGLAFVAASLPCAGGFPCALGDLAPGASTIVTVTYTVGAGLGGSVTNTATVTSTTADPDLANNESRVVTPVMPAATSADLVLAKTGPASATPGGQVTYTLHVRNAGPDAALDVVLADPTPANLAFVAASTPCEAGFPCHLGTLASGADTVVTTTYAVAAAATGAIVNSASVTATTPDPDLGNNASSASTTLVAAPAASADLRITKSGPARATAGTVVTYTLVVSNEGPDAVADALLTDPTPAGLAFVAASAPCGSGFPCTLPALASGASTTLTVSYLVQPTFVGRVTNVVSVASTTVPDPTPNNNASAATTFVAGAPLAPTQVPVDARWMLLLMSALLLLAGSAAVRRRR